MKNKMIFNITIIGMMLVTLLAGCGEVKDTSKNGNIQEIVQEAEDNDYVAMSPKMNAPGTGYRTYSCEEVREESTWIHHEAEYGTVHHEAEYKTIYHEAVYETVHHPAVHKKELVYFSCECGALDLPD